MERDKILDGKSFDPVDEKTDNLINLISETADKILEIIVDRKEYPSKLDIELTLRRFARDFGNLLLFGDIYGREKDTEGRDSQAQRQEDK